MDSTVKRRGPDRFMKSAPPSDRRCRGDPRNAAARGRCRPFSPCPPEVPSAMPAGPRPELSDFEDEDTHFRNAPPPNPA
eukprot:15443428-Alexandrium_andersonii.AAC.1